MWCLCALGLLVPQTGLAQPVPAASQATVARPNRGAAGRMMGEMLAGVGAGVFGGVADAADALVRVVERTAPDAAASAYYREAHGTYRALYGDLKERFAAMAAPV